jgi:hypothetical protein
LQITSFKNINYLVTDTGVSALIETIRNPILTILGGFFSLLGFTIGGLALLTGTIGAEVITKLREEKKIDHLMSVIFNFYFCGVVTGLTAILSLITYIITFIPMKINIILFYIWGLLYCYLIIFSIIYSVMLLGTCIRLFLLRYFYIMKIDEETTKDSRKIK